MLLYVQKHYAYLFIHFIISHADIIGIGNAKNNILSDLRHFLHEYTIASFDHMY